MWKQVHDGYNVVGWNQIGKDLPGFRDHLAADISLNKARALHRVWQSLNEGNCPKCHKSHAATDIKRSENGSIQCPSCWFTVTGGQAKEIELLFDVSVAIFEAWVGESATGA